MNLVLKNININNIIIDYTSYKFYKIYYKTDYTKTTGITISINVKNIKKYLYNYLYYIIIEDKNTLDTLINLGNYINKQVDNFSILRKNKNVYYIICKYIYSKNINNLINIDINIKYIKYLNYKYVPIIYII